MLTGPRSAASASRSRGFASAGLFGLVRLALDAVVRKHVPTKTANRLVNVIATGVAIVLIFHALRPLHSNQAFAREAGVWISTNCGFEKSALLTDNPLVFASEDAADAYYLPRLYKAVSCGNFHGQPLAFAMDFLSIAIAELGSIAERRIFRLLTGVLNHNLEAMLIRSVDREAGMHNGFMIAQYTASALVSENKTLAHPDSVDSIPTCEDQEDHVSMSSNAARHARQIIWNVQQIIGIEMLCAAQALDFRLEGQEYVQYCDGGSIRRGWQKTESDTSPALGVGTRAAYDHLRTCVEHRRRDRVLYPDMARVAREVSSGGIVQAVDAALAGSMT